METFVWPVRVYYEDTDAGGVVFYANYLKFLERARTEWLRSLGFEQDTLREQGVVFAVRKVVIDYLRPALFNQLLDVHTQVIAVGTASITFNQRVLDGSAVLTEATVKLACVDAETFRPRPVPDVIQEEIKRVS
jgi:acyl-CoA thioester hydrolase